MRVNLYSEELTYRSTLVQKEVDGTLFYGVRFYLELPAVKGQARVSGPFVDSAGRDDSAAVTFWADDKVRLRSILLNAANLLSLTIQA